MGFLDGEMESLDDEMESLDDGWTAFLNDEMSSQDPPRS
jgi:hypothetical protein